MTSTGVSMSTEPAINMFQGVGERAQHSVNSARKNRRASARVRQRSVSMKISGWRNSFQCWMKEKIAEAASAGRVRGMRIIQ